MVRPSNVHTKSTLLKAPLATSEPTKRKRRKRRWKKRWVREVKDNAQKATVIPRASIARLIREILQSAGRDFNTDFRMGSNAMDAVQCAAEQYATDVMRMANDLTVLSRVQTVDVRHFKKAASIVASR